MRKQLTAEHALITTATVEVKTLTISGRQVTLAVFRQLPRADLVNEDTLQLNGVPWGHVNYHWGELSGLHVVWQKGNVLYRDLIHRLSEKSDCRSVRYNDAFQKEPIQYKTSWVSSEGDVITGFALTERYNAVVPDFEDDYSDEIDAVFDEAKSALALLPATRARSSTPEYKTLVNSLTEEVRSIARRQWVARLDYIHRWNAAVEPLFQLDQLFIAV